MHDRLAQQHPVSTHTPGKAVCTGCHQHGHGQLCTPVSQTPILHSLVRLLLANASVHGDTLQDREADRCGQALLSPLGGTQAHRQDATTATLSRSGHKTATSRSVTSETCRGCAPPWTGWQPPWSYLLPLGVPAVKLLGFRLAHHHGVGGLEVGRVRHQ